MERGFFQFKQEFVSYRRNYFQISCGVIAPDLDGMVIKETGLSVLGFIVSISAKIKNVNTPVSLIQHTPKRDKGPMHDPEPKTIMPGGNPFQLDGGNGVQVTTFERIQFKSATANNGKRKAAQQYFSVVLDLHARTVNGDVHIGYCESNSLIVRGRSPSHYSDHNQLVPLTARPDGYSMNSALSPYPMSAASRFGSFSTSPDYSMISPNPLHSPNHAFPTDASYRQNQISSIMEPQHRQNAIPKLQNGYLSTGDSATYSSSPRESQSMFNLSMDSTNFDFYLSPPPQFMQQSKAQTIPDMLQSPFSPSLQTRMNIPEAHQKFSPRQHHMPYSPRSQTRMQVPNANMPFSPTNQLQMPIPDIIQSLNQLQNESNSPTRLSSNASDLQSPMMHFSPNVQSISENLQPLAYPSVQSNLLSPNRKMSISFETDYVNQSSQQGLSADQVQFQLPSSLISPVMCNMSLDSPFMEKTPNLSL